MARALAASSESGKRLNPSVHVARMRCKIAAGSKLRFANRPSPNFFRLTMKIRMQNLAGGPVFVTPLHLGLTGPGAIDQNDHVDSCGVNESGNRTTCKDTP